MAVHQQSLYVMPCLDGRGRYDRMLPVTSVGPLMHQYMFAINVDHGCPSHEYTILKSILSNADQVIP